MWVGMYTSNEKLIYYEAAFTTRYFIIDACGNKTFQQHKSLFIPNYLINFTFTNLSVWKHWKIVLFKGNNESEWGIKICTVSIDLIS